MKIERNTIPELSLATFATRNGLTLLINERPKDGADRFYARFKGVEVQDGRCLISNFGNGYTEKEAIHSYAKEIQFKTLVVDAMKPTRKEIAVPRLKEARGDGRD